MKSTAKGMLKTLATRSVIAAIPVAMVTAYAGIGSVPTPPRMAEYGVQLVAEINVSPSTVGIATSPLYGQTQAQVEAQLDQMQALGVENIRVFVPWALIEYAPVSAANPNNSYYWDALDVVMEAAEARNMGVLAEVNFTPSWAAANGEPTYNGLATADPTAFAAFMGDFAARYGSTVSAYEIWNEPNAVLFSNPIDPAGYAALLKAAYPVIKAADPTATVIAGALGHVVNFGNLTMDPVDFLNGMIAAGAAGGYDVQDYFDALSYHPYDESLAFTDGNIPLPSNFPFAQDTAYNQIKQLLAILDPDKRVWLTEFGVPTYTYTQTNPFTGLTETVTVTQQDQEDLIKNLVENWGKASFWNDPVTLARLGPLFLYTGRDTATGSTDPNANYGLWTSLGIPKEVVTDFLAQWYAANPQNPSGPVDPPVDPPTDPNAALQAALQALANQIAQAFATAIQQAFVNGLGQQIANAIVTAIANALAGLGQPAAPATSPLTLRTASVEAAEDTSLAEEPAAKTAEVSTLSGEAPAATIEAAPAATPVTEATEVTATTPEVTTPEVTVPEVTVPEVKVPEVKVPEVKVPEVTVPEVKVPAATEPAATTPSADTGTAATPKSDSDGPKPTKDDDSKKGKKDDDGAKSGDADKSSPGKLSASTEAAKTKSDKGSADADAKSTASAETKGPAAKNAPSESAAAE